MITGRKKSKEGQNFETEMVHNLGWIFFKIKNKNFKYLYSTLVPQVNLYSNTYILYISFI